MTTLLLVWHPALLGTLGPARPLLYEAEAADELRIVDAGDLALEEAAALALRRAAEHASSRWRLVVAAPAEPFASQLPQAFAQLLSADGLEQVIFLLIGGDAAAAEFGEVAARFDHLGGSGLPARRVLRAPTLLERSGTAPLELGYLLLYLVGGAPNLAFESHLASGGVRLSGALGEVFARYRLGLERAAHDLESLPISVPVQLFDEEMPLLEGVALPETEGDLVGVGGAPAPEIPPGWIAPRARERDHDAWLLWRDAAEGELAAAEAAIEERNHRTLAGGLERLAELREVRGARSAGVPLDRDALRAHRAAIDTDLEALKEPTAPGRSRALASWDHALWRQHDRVLRRALARRPALPQLIAAPLLALAPLLLAATTERPQGTPWLLIAALLGFVAALGVTIDALRRPLAEARGAVRTTVRDRLRALRSHQQDSRRLIAAQLALWRAQQNGRMLDAAAEALRLRTRLREYHEDQLRRHLAWQREIASLFPETDPPTPTPFETGDWSRDVAELPLYRPVSYAGDATPPTARCGESELVLPLPRFAGLAGIDLTPAGPD